MIIKNNLGSLCQWKSVVRLEPDKKYKQDKFESAIIIYSKVFGQQSQPTSKFTYCSKIKYVLETCKHCKPGFHYVYLYFKLNTKYQQQLGCD